MNSPECAARTARRLRAEAAGMLDTRLGDPPPNRSALAERLNRPPAEARRQAPPRGEPLPRPQDLQGTPASR
jgi:hypothetical protein